MDDSADSGFLPPSAIGKAVTPQERPLLNTPCQSESGGTILLQLLEFKTHLLEAVVELHIQRDAETRYENQLGKVVLEKQELEWEKETLQNQMETVKKQHGESLINVKKQLQAKIRNTEEEKGKYQVISELKEREIGNLKEELKSLQLLKYNFEKKSNELEQKQTLQIRSKDSHLIQIGEVEKRFGALSRQCATLKKAHEQLEQNVDEAMKRNKKLTATNEKHEATIQALIKELEEVNTKLIKTKLSSVRHDNTYCMMTHTEQNLNQLSYKLSLEKEMNNRLREEYAALRSEKQEVIKSLQQTQQLFLNQIQAVNRLELQLQAREDQHKSLKQEHEEMREKSKAMEEKVAQLMSEQQDFQALKEVHDDLQQKHNELSAQVKVHAQNIHELEMFPSLTEGTRGRPPDEPKSSSTLPGFGSLQNSAVSQSKILDCLEDTSVKTKLDGEMGETPKFHVKSETQLQVQWEKAFSIHSPKRLPGLSETMDSDDTLLNKTTRSYNTSEKLSNKVSNLICSTSHQSTNELANSEGVVDGINISNSGNMSSNDQLTKDRKSVHGSTSQSGADCSGMHKVNEANNNSNEGRRNQCQPRNAEDLLEERCAGEQKKIIISQTADSGNSEEYSRMGAHESNTETLVEIRNGEKEEGKRITETEAQTTCDIKSNDPPDSDFVDISEKIGTVCEADCYQKDTEKVADRSLVNMTEFHLLQDLSCPEEQNLSNGAIEIMEEAQHSCQADVLTNAESVNSSLTSAHPVVEKTSEVTRLDESTVNIQTKYSDLIQSAGSVTSQRMIEPTIITSSMTHTDEMSGTDTYEKVKKIIVVGKGGSHNQTTAELANGRMEDFESDAYKEACGTAFQTQPVSCDGDLNISISNQDNAVDSKNSESVLSGSVQPKSGNVESFEVGTSEFLEQPAVKETLVDAEELSLPILETYRPSFDWSDAIKQTVLATATSDYNLQPNVQNSPVSEQNSSVSCGLLTQFPCTLFLKSQHSKEPLMIIRASDLLKASGAPASTGFGRKHKMGEWSIFGESFRETAATDESRVSLAAPSCPVSSSSSTWPTPSGTSVPGVAPRSDAELEHLCSQEEQQSSFRAQISKIEQFLQTERLHLSKRRRTDK
ncbi:coiled-coil domain-containing protein 73-like isoform X2 [Phyllopteryx taeniolatus]|uniref:coiled-coil domain-containing protein 73-like isoform X2 n=1 Tax=Phyllopteryx taeniolatus TaxID=161469 RepID=UPI002AD50EBD|nr:coiled-coil domain-containing protein 73-like isoform X2 [Phyllopteryx taeniolatus]